MENGRAPDSLDALLEPTERWLEEKFRAKPILAEANKLALKAGFAYCEATQAFQVSYEVPPAKLDPGTYRNLSGNTALAPRQPHLEIGEEAIEPSPTESTEKSARCGHLGAHLRGVARARALGAALAATD